MRTGTRKVVYYCNCQISRESLHTVLHYKYVRYYCTHDNKAGLKRSGIKREKEKKPPPLFLLHHTSRIFPYYTHILSLTPFIFFPFRPRLFFSRMWETVFFVSFARFVCSLLGITPSPVTDALGIREMTIRPPSSFSSPSLKPTR